jgi:taurine dioxygenase
MTTQTKVKELSPFVAEAELDLSNPASGSEFRRLYDKYGVLIFRNQSLNTDQHIRAMENLGTVHLDWRLISILSNTRSDGMLGNAEIDWHSDFAFVEKPNLTTTLFAIEVGDKVTSTIYADSVGVLEKLPPTLRKRIESLSFMSLYPNSTYGLRQRLADYPADKPRTVHPLIMTDPVTGQRALFVNETNTDSIVGLPDEESEALLTELKSYIYAPENTYEHFWENGDVVVWNNITTQHRRGVLDKTKERTLRRVCVADGPVEMYMSVGSDRRPPGAMFEGGKALAVA